MGYKAENEFEHHAKETKLKAKLYELHKRNVHLQSETACVKAVSTVPTGCAEVWEPSTTINQLRADPVLTERVSTEIDQLGLSLIDPED